MAWKLRYVQYDITASKSGERFWKRLYNHVPEPELILVLREECSCLDDGYDWPAHTNGGNYHYIWKVYRLDDEHILIMQNTTREAFTPWEQGFIYLKNNEGIEYCVWTETIQDVSAEVYTKEEARKMILELLNNGDVYIEEGELANI
jgi:hypothetical protein